MQKKIIFGIIILSLLAVSAFSQDKKSPEQKPPQPPKEGETVPPPPPRPDNPEPPMRKDFYNYRGIRRNISDYPIEIIVADLRVPENKRNKS